MERSSVAHFRDSNLLLLATARLVKSLFVPVVVDPLVVGSPPPFFPVPSPPTFRAVVPCALCAGGEVVLGSGGGGASLVLGRCVFVVVFSPGVVGIWVPFGDWMLLLDVLVTYDLQDPSLACPFPLLLLLLLLLLVARLLFAMGLASSHSSSLSGP